MSYNVIDCQTGQVVRSFSSRKQARKYADHMDLQYGAVRYSVRMV